jgi:hypothetical protein
LYSKIFFERVNSDFSLILRFYYSVLHLSSLDLNQAGVFLFFNTFFYYEITILPLLSFGWLRNLLIIFVFYNEITLLPFKFVQSVVFLKGCFDIFICVIVLPFCTSKSFLLQKIRWGFWYCYLKLL